jgi:Bifunctional DNA primase/polymerase, N-terminal
MIGIVLDYAARGFQCFPVRPAAKEPATRNGFKDATANPATLRRWFNGAYSYNVGIRTGVPSGVFVLDVDGDQGASNLRELETFHGGLPSTLTSSTGNGKHLWFRIEGPIPCSAGKIAPGIDVRGDGGYVARRQASIRPAACTAGSTMNLRHKRPHG